MIHIYLKPKKEESLRRFHPWIFSGAIHHIEGNPTEGDIVKVLDSLGKFLAVGYYQIGSIMVRVLSFEDEVIDLVFFKDKISKAYNLRRDIGLIRSDNNTYRLVHGEGDFLPGLIVDIYGETAIIQSHTVFMHLFRHEIANAIANCIPDVHNVFYKSETTLPFKAGIESNSEFLLKKNDTITSVAIENGLQFYIDWLKGQKTGFFVDQRENRLLLESYANGKSVLNMFCYTGGFSVYAMRGGAKLVHSVDSSAKAIELTNNNIDLNFSGDNRHLSFADDAFQFLSKNQQKYDIIILDPPAFAKHRAALHNALKGYKRLNKKGFESIKEGGMLFTFSCSQIVSKEQFRLAVFSAAAETGRKVRILHQLSQPSDHPINIYHPEGEYLKGLVLWVE